MSRRLVIRPQAAREIRAAAEWYQGRRRGLGDDFLRVVEACIAGIGRYPHMYSIVHRDFRRAVLRRFPYLVLYRVTDSEIVIFACVYGRQDPETWKNRL